MDMMMLGETIAYEPEGAATEYFGYWMPSGGDDVTGAIDVIALSTATKFTVKLQTKNSEDADSSASNIGSSAIAATGVTKFDASSAKELVRYMISVDSTGDEYMHFQFMQPQWVRN